jgi:hypothetical protein
VDWVDGSITFKNVTLSFKGCVFVTVNVFYVRASPTGKQVNFSSGHADNLLIDGDGGRLKKYQSFG